MARFAHNLARLSFAMKRARGDASEAASSAATSPPPALADVPAAALTAADYAALHSALEAKDLALAALAKIAAAQDTALAALKETIATQALAAASEALEFAPLVLVALAGG